MLKQLRPAISLTLAFLVLAGLVFPGIVWAIGQTAFKDKANGSMIRDANGNIVGSGLIAQSFTRPEYFHPRPSAAGSGYDPTNSGGTNLGPTSDKLINGIHKKLPNGKDDPGNFDGIKDLAAAYRIENKLAPDAEIPSDAVTRSASGLDPDITPANAEVQAGRVAEARHMPKEQVLNLINANTTTPFLGIFGDSSVNVLKLNLALDKEKG
ncbi:MAG TPA: K(+)-transporting ATPase subunit C [Fimbriimonadaceae bacterium]|jgi:K+-transporting ATPase ATPase C chain